MPTVRRFESKVSKVEGFEIQIMQNGSDVRSDKKLPNTYTAKKRSKEEWTVAEWKTKKFDKMLAGYDVNLLNADGTVANGNTKLASVRKSYIDDESNG